MLWGEAIKPSLKDRCSPTALECNNQKGRQCLPGRSTSPSLPFTETTHLTSSWAHSPWAMTWRISLDNVKNLAGGIFFLITGYWINLFNIQYFQEGKKESEDVFILLWRFLDTGWKAREESVTARDLGKEIGGREWAGGLFFFCFFTATLTMVTPSAAIADLLPPLNSSSSSSSSHGYPHLHNNSWLHVFQEFYFAAK